MVTAAPDEDDLKASITPEMVDPFVSHNEQLSQIVKGMHLISQNMESGSMENIILNSYEKRRKALNDLEPEIVFELE